MNWQRCGGKLLWPKLRYYSRIFVEALRKTTKTSARIASDLAEI
jgi:hypothetical protein